MTKTKPRTHQWPVVAADDAGIRPAGPPDACFYCNAKVGELHGPKCVCVTRRVLVRYAYEVELDVPHHWTGDEVEFHRNDSSWCADNAAHDVRAHVERAGLGCACSIFEATFLRETDGSPRAARHSPAEVAANEVMRASLAARREGGRDDN